MDFGGDRDRGTMGDRWAIRNDEAKKGEKKDKKQWVFEETDDQWMLKSNGGRKQ